MDRDSFREYIRQSEPDKREKGYLWHTAIGLQAVDGLEPSHYLVNTAVKNIEGEITLDEAQQLLNSYYAEKPENGRGSRTEEADKVSVRIAQALSEKAFSFTPNEYISIHKKLFYGIFSHAGKIRNYNITKKEWVLDGDSVLYGSASELRATLDYDFSEERKFSYKNLSMDEMIRHLAFFLSRLWQIHLFGEGNTRTTAVFFIKYLRRLGFDAENDIFAENAWYFRNALVRANYSNIKKGVYETTEYLELFLRNLLLNEKNELRNRSMHISREYSYSPAEKADIQTQKSNIRRQKPDIESIKTDIKVKESSVYSTEPDIERKKMDIHRRLTDHSEIFFEKTIDHIMILYKKYGQDLFFGRSCVEEITGLKSSRASELLKLMLESGIIAPVKGHGKGKYHFT